jgi:hypothetical protein
MLLSPPLHPSIVQQELKWITQSGFTLDLRKMGLAA